MTDSKYNMELADTLQKLCCAETEGKFFDCVTDNIDTILEALRPAPVLGAGGDTFSEEDGSIAALKARADGDAKSCSEMFKRMEAIRDAANAALGMPWLRQEGTAAPVVGAGVRAQTIEECAKIAEGFPQLIPTSPKHVRQVSGADIAKAIRAPSDAVTDTGGSKE